MLGSTDRSIAHSSTIQNCSITLQCEASLEKLERMSLPSLGRFDAKAAQCMGAFDSGCTGPARKHQWERLQHAHTRERARFQQEYNNRLYNGLTMAALGTALLCRFVFKQTIAELGGWAAFVFLEVRYIWNCMQVNALHKTSVQNSCVCVENGKMVGCCRRIPRSQWE